jgi:hypothetical protein
MPLNRRSSATSGCVHWPTHLTSRGDGGMFVRLVVENEDFMVCCGGDNYIFQDECFVGSDILSTVSTDAFDDALEAEHQYIFPRNHGEDALASLSTPYICCMTIASTGASYYDKDKERNWICTFDDLTANGQDLYRRIEALYPDGTITLQTWLDT